MRKEGPWVLDARVALEMLEEAERRGLLDPANDDLFLRWGSQGVPEPIDSRKLTGRALDRTWDQLLFDSRDREAWRPGGEFLVCVEPGGVWRKAVLFHRPSQTLTFRGLTTDTSYGPVKKSELQSDWRIDNSMQDMPAQFVRAYLGRLRKYLAD